ncbi:small acid-soluble spore protein P [Paenibacillus sediminis]|uniref:Small acid-soluble spore protein P (Minor) n=1 Tax=Paenibacillus sediminis TaxID=664909 RepID=A0ABS4H7Z4_9BACL|nr:small acid-soluble spore protein P [Paenibacillus sediminis]MBP1938586.1 small acid-soluble spore protein P (minor) [Paenibacillus sediminis]
MGGKSKAVPVPEAQQPHRHHSGQEQSAVKEPLSGSKKVKNRNHVGHNNPEG